MSAILTVLTVLFSLHLPQVRQQIAYMLDNVLTTNQNLELLMPVLLS